MARRTTKELREHNSRQAKLAALRQEEQRRKNRMRMTLAAIGAVLVVVIALVAVGLTRGGHNSGPAGATTASGALTRDLSTIPAATYNTAGAPAQSPAIPLGGAPRLSSGGKPDVVYVGAEYCPFCAAERWALVASLARFGTFSHLGETRSSSTDTDPNTPTLSFEGAKFSSRYVTFRGFEIADRADQPLDALPARVNQLINKYGREPYVAGASRSQPPPIPFIDFGGRFIVDGASYDPALLQGMTHQQVADQIRQANSKVGQAVLKTANAMTAMICAQTDNQPTRVCTSTAVEAAKTGLQ